MTQFAIPCVVYRGGTSRGVFFHKKDLPEEKALQEEIFLRAIGAEDASHVDGLGGGTSHTSKVVIIDKSDQVDADIDYTFVQLGMGSNVIDYEGTCGNLMAAVGAFAVDEGLVDVSDDMESVKVSVWNTNIQRYLTIHVPLQKGNAKVTGDYLMSGVFHSGAKYLVNIENPGGGKTGRTLPLRAVSSVQLDGKSYEISFCDIVNPFVYVEAESLGLSGTELNKEIMNKPSIMQLLEGIREHAAVESKLSANIIEAREHSPAIPKVAFVSTPKDYYTSTGKLIKKEDYDILARMVSMGKMHRTFAVSGLLNVAGACLLEGTIPYKLCQRECTNKEETIRIGHPEGVISVRVKKHEQNERIEYVGLERTARRIMSGNLLIPIQDKQR